MFMKGREEEKREKEGGRFVTACQEGGNGTWIQDFDFSLKYPFLKNAWVT